MNKTQIILNPYAAGGRAGKLWNELETLLVDRLGELALAITYAPEEVLPPLEQALMTGFQRVVSIGGDGTNHALVNALASLGKQYPEKPPLPYGMLPVGTGRDWARSQGIPFDFIKAVDWLASATPKPTDIGLLTLEPGTPQEKHIHFLNIASAGLGGDVDARVNRVTHRQKWTFFRATVESIIAYTPQHMRIMLDGEPWYDDKATVAVIANGTTFGHGMKIAPEASVYDGLFDVLVIEALSKVRLLTALGHVYRGTHLTQDGVHFKRAKTVQIESNDGEIALDLDGEYKKGHQLNLSIQPGLLHLLS